MATEKRQQTINRIARVGGHQGHFDVFNSASTGHQVSDGAPARGWRETRQLKLTKQYKDMSGVAGVAVKVQDTLPSEKTVDIPAGDRAKVKDIEKDTEKLDENPTRPLSALEQARLIMQRMQKQQAALSTSTKSTSQPGPRPLRPNPRPPAQPPRPTISTSPQIFASLVIYVNGSTQPLISDHKLKRLLVAHGASISLHLARRQVTHVILGRASCRGGGVGAGGGLASGKRERERRVQGCFVRYVPVEWVLESVKAGKRLAEARFATVDTGGMEQRSVYSMFSKV